MIKNRRRTYFIGKKFQTKFIVKFCLLIISGALITGGTLYFLTMRSTTVVFENTCVAVKTTADFLLPVLIQTIIVTAVIIGIAAIFLTLLISHKISGPLYSFNKRIKSMGEGNLSGDYHIRKGDQLQEINKSLNETIKKLREAHTAIRDDWQSFRSLWEDKQKTAEIKRIIEKVGERLNYFKI